MDWTLMRCRLAVAAGSLNGTGSVSQPSALSFGGADGTGNVRARNKVTAMQIRLARGNASTSVLIICATYRCRYSLCLKSS